MSEARKNLQKLAKKIRRQGRFGDTDLVHMSPAELKLLKEMSGKEPTINPVTGLKEYWAWIPAAITAVSSIASASSKKKADSAIIKKQEELERAKIKGELEALDAQKQISPFEAQAIENLREGSREGTLDVEALNQQMAQPIYQQGQMQTSEAMGQITSQGLEGSIIAQNVAARIGADTRASIADQARSIAMANQQTKEGARRQLNERMFARADMLRQIAANRKRVEQGLEALPIQSDIARLQSSSDYDQSMLSAATGLASGIAGSFNTGAPDLDLDEFGLGNSDPNISLSRNRGY